MCIYILHKFDQALMTGQWPSDGSEGVQYHPTRLNPCASFNLVYTCAFNRIRMPVLRVALLEPMCARVWSYGASRCGVRTLRILSRKRFDQA